MKQKLSFVAFVLAFLLSAVAASAQGVYIFKDGKKQVFKSEEIDSLVFFVSDDDPSPVVDEENFELPSTNFSQKLSELAAAEQMRGFSVSTEGDSRLVLTKGEGDMTQQWEYNADTAGAYKYAKCQLPAGKVDAFKAFLRRQGYAMEARASLNDDVQAYVNKSLQTVLYINKDGDRFEYFFGSYDEGFNSWMRVSFLRDEATSVWMPFYGQGATVELMQLFEKRMNHRLDAEKSKVGSGVYVYATGDDRWPSVKYWFDVATKSRLEEASLYVNAENIPSPEQLTEYLQASRHVYTSMYDSEGDVIYYNYDLKSACFVKMADKTEGKTAFEPQMHYAYTNFDASVPPLKVDFPMPITTFGTKTMDEIAAEYRQQPYYKSEETNELGLVVNTTSEDFPVILLLEDGGKYYAAMVVTFDNLKVRSPYIVNLLRQSGYEDKPGVSALPTFVNTELDVMAQFDLIDILQMGWFTVSFQPNEFK